MQGPPESTVLKSDSWLEAFSSGMTPSPSYAGCSVCMTLPTVGCCVV